MDLMNWDSGVNDRRLNGLLLHDWLNGLPCVSQAIGKGKTDEIPHGHGDVRARQR